MLQVNIRRPEKYPEPTKVLEDLIAQRQRGWSRCFNLKTLNLPLNSVILFKNILHNIPESGLKLCVALQRREGFLGTDCFS